LVLEHELRLAERGYPLHVVEMCPRMVTQRNLLSSACAAGPARPQAVRCRQTPLLLRSCSKGRRKIPVGLRGVGRLSSPGLSNGTTDTAALGLLAAARSHDCI